MQDRKWRGKVEVRERSTGKGGKRRFRHNGGSKTHGRTCCTIEIGPSPTHQPATARQPKSQTSGAKANEQLKLTISKRPFSKRLIELRSLQRREKPATRPGSLDAGRVIPLRVLFRLYQMVRESFNSNGIEIQNSNQFQWESWTFPYASSKY